MAGPTFLASPVDVSTTTTGSYVDVDVSANVSADATAAIIMLENVSTGTLYGTYVRQNGSTDDRYVAGGGLGYGATSLPIINMLIVGLDGDKIFEQKIQDASVNCYLYGYVEAECVWLTNATDKSTVTTGSFVDVDIASDTGAATATAAIVEGFRGSTNNVGMRVRQNGSTDATVTWWYYDGTTSFRRFDSWVVGCDGSEIFEQYI